MTNSTTPHDYCGTNLYIPETPSTGKQDSNTRLWECWCPKCKIHVHLSTAQVIQAHKKMASDKRKEEMEAGQ